MSPGQVHSLSFSSDIEGYIFLFTSEFYLLNQKNKSRLLEFPFFFSTERNNPPLLLNDESDIAFIQQLFKRACNEVDATKETNKELLCSILDLLLVSCNNLYPITTNAIKGKSNILVKKFLLQIEENYHKNLRINDYAARLNVTPNHLTQVIKQITGKTSAELLHEKTIVETKRLLFHTSLSIAEIADIMHFADQSYFTKFFKKSTGNTPLQYRKGKSIP